MARTKSNPWEAEIDSILQRLTRQSSEVEQPPDEARGSLGRRLGNCFVSGLQAQNEDDASEKALLQASDKILILLTNPTTNVAVVHEFFLAVETGDAQKKRNLKIEWVSSWILRVQDEEDVAAPPQHTLRALIHLYSSMCLHASSTQEKEFSMDHVLGTYWRLTMPHTRLCFQQELIRRAFSGTTHSIRALLSPLVAAVAINCATPVEERVAFVQTVLQHSRSAVKRHNQIDMMSVVVWLLDALKLLLMGMPGESSNHQPILTEMAHYWLRETVDLAASQNTHNRSDDDDDNPDTNQLLQSIVTVILKDILPFFVLGPPSSFRVSLADTLSAIVDLAAPSLHSDEALFKLATMILATPMKEESLTMLQLLYRLSGSDNSWVCWVSKCVATIFANDSVCQDMAKVLFSQAQAKISSKTDQESHFLQEMGMLAEDTHAFLQFMTDALSTMDDNANASVEVQNALVLIGSMYLGQKTYVDSAMMFVKTVLEKFPHLGIPILPVLMKAVSDATQQEDAPAMMKYVEFMCSALVHDPYCAQEVWNVVGIGLLDTQNPVPIRALAIRMYPALCAQNRRLYRRIVDTLGNVADEKQPEIRLAVAATICDMAKEDLLRDVSEVIGWIQTHLEDENPAVVHLAIMSLHHLVLVEELDFDLVVKVLNKRLAPVGDLTKVVELDGLVLEALTVLLGDGEASGDDSGDDDGVSPQVAMSIDVLIGLARSDLLTKPNQFGLGEESASRIAFNIRQALTAYSWAALQIEAEDLKLALQQGDENGEKVSTRGSQRYLALTSILCADLQASNFGPSIKLCQKVLALEEDALGASVWQKVGRAPTASRKRIKVTKAAIAALPDPKVVRQRYDQDPTAFAAIAALLCHDGEDFDCLADYAGDLSSERLEPVMQTFCIQGWMQCMGRVWANVSSSRSTSKLEDLTNLFDGLRGWLQTHDVDYVYLAGAALCLYVPNYVQDANGAEVSFLDVINDWMVSVEDAFKAHQFQNLDVAYVALAFVGMKMLRSSAFSGTERIVELLEAGTSQSSFGAPYGLALVGRAVQMSLSSSTIDSAQDLGRRNQLICRITSVLTHELLLCTKGGENNSLIALVAALKQGESSKGLVESVASIGELALEPTQEVRATSLFCSLALSAPTVGSTDATLSLAIYEMLQKLPWGSGKGFALAVVALECRAAGVFNEQALKEVHEACYTDLTSGEEPAFDSLYALSLLETHFRDSGSDDVNPWLNTVDEDLLGGDSLLALVPLVGSFPCLGCRERNVYIPSMLSALAPTNLISLVTETVSKLRAKAGLKKKKFADVVEGLVASLALPPIKSTEFVDLQSKKDEVHQEQVAALDASRLPIGHEGTLLSFVTESLQVQGKSGFVSEMSGNLFRCLEPLSLPRHFASCLLAPLLTTISSTTEDTRVAALELLSAQFQGRRKAAFEGRDFVALAVRVALLPAPTLLRQFGDSGAVLCKALGDLLKKSPFESVEGIAVSTWSVCVAHTEKEEKSSHCHTWLSALHKLFEETAEKTILSPKVVTLLRRFLAKKVLQSLSDMPGASAESLLATYSTCLGLVPLSFLIQERFEKFDKSRPFVTECYAAYCWCGRLKGEDVDKTTFRSNMVALIAWFAAQNPADDDTNATALRRLAVRIAITIEVVDESTMKQVMTLLLESMLVNGSGSMSLELLNLIVGRWCHKGRSVIGVAMMKAKNVEVLLPRPLSALMDSALVDLPSNIGLLARRLKFASVLSNLILRIHQAWDGEQTGKKAILRMVLMHCKTVDSYAQDAGFLVASALSQDLKNT